jgi:hypothetical protein
MREQRKLDPKRFQQDAAQRRERQRGYGLKYRHGITVEQWDRLLEEQEGKCYLCNEEMSSNPHLDHDHSCCPGKRACGKCVRGLACQKCNQGIGQFGDDPERMRRVADNLEKANQILRDRSVEKTLPNPEMVPAEPGTDTPGPAHP